MAFAFVSLSGARIYSRSGTGSENDKIREERYGDGKGAHEIISLVTGDEQERAAAAKKTAETFERKRDLLRQRGETLRFEFVASELDLAITFCESAASTSDPEKSKRSVLRAKEAYETAKHFLSGEQISEPMRRTIQEKISRLELLLNKAG